MPLDPQITYRNIDSSPAIEAKVHRRIENLYRFYDDIMSCRIMLEAQHRHHHKGKIYHVRIDVTVPGHELVVNRDPKEHQAHEDLYVAIRDAFDAMDRKLKDLSYRQHHRVKTHEVPAHGRVHELAEDYGRIETPDGRSIYFYANSVLNNAFSRIKLGTEVRFVEEAGDNGPQASSVTLLGKQQFVG